MTVPDQKDLFARKGLLSLLVDTEMASTIREDLEYQRSMDREEKSPLIAALRHAVRLAARNCPAMS